MLLRLSAFVFLSFGGLYPLWLWVNWRDAIDQGFFRFSVGLGAVVLGLGVLLVTIVPEAAMSRPWVAMVWLGVALSSAAYVWQQRPGAQVVIAVSPVVGLFVLFDYLSGVPTGSAGIVPSVATTAVGGVALGGSMYTMVLGHHYLNAEKMPTRFLGKAIFVYAVVLAVRLGWDISVLASGSVNMIGMERSAMDFALSIDGMFIWIALFFGTILPLVICYLAGEALRAKSTQAATGLLYVAVSAAIIGEASYRFDLLAYGLAL